MPIIKLKKHFPFIQYYMPIIKHIKAFPIHSVLHAHNKAHLSISHSFSIRSDLGKYRPISLLSIVSKIFESFINDGLTKHLDSTGLFSDLQYGFRTLRSTADILTVLSERIYNSIDAGGETGAIALDISKAFDKVSTSWIAPQAEILWCCWPHPRYLGIFYD